MGCGIHSALTFILKNAALIDVSREHCSDLLTNISTCNEREVGITNKHFHSENLQVITLHKIMAGHNCGLRNSTAVSVKGMRFFAICTGSIRISNS
jgi:hypothetical protein